MSDIGNMTTEELRQLEGVDGVVAELARRLEAAEAKAATYWAECEAWRKRAKYDGSKGEFNAIKMSDADIEVQSARAANGEVGQ